MSGIEKGGAGRGGEGWRAPRSNGDVRFTGDNSDTVSTNPTKLPELLMLREINPLVSRSADFINLESAF